MKIARLTMFHFSQYSTPLLIGFLQGMVFAVLLFRRSYREGNLPDRLLAWLLVCCCVYIAQYMLGFGNWYDSWDARSTFMFYFPFHTLFFIGPLIYLYFRSLTNQEFVLQRKSYLHFIPGAAVLSLYLVVFWHDVVIGHWVQGNPFPLFYGTQGFWARLRQEFVPTIPIGLLSTLVYTLLTLRVYRRYRNYLIQNFSTIEGLQFGWLRILLYTIVLALVVNWAVEILSVFMDFSYPQYWFSYFAFAIMTYILAIQGYATALQGRNRLKFEPADVAEVEKILPEKEAADLERWKIRLEKYIEKERPYLEPQLTLSDLAQRIGTNTSVLSKVINQGFDQNFNDFINDHRIRIVRSQLHNGAAENFTLMSIALDAGFNSKATFNRAFRKFSGMSPKEYLEQMGRAV